VPREGEPKSVIRWSAGEWALLDGLAEGAGVATGALVREAALRAARDVVADVRGGRLELRTRNGARRDEAPVVVPRRQVSKEEFGAARADAFRRMTGG